MSKGVEHSFLPISSWISLFSQIISILFFPALDRPHKLLKGRAAVCCFLSQCHVRSHSSLSLSSSFTSSSPRTRLASPPNALRSVGFTGSVSATFANATTDTKATPAPFELATGIIVLLGHVRWTILALVMLDIRERNAID